MARLVHNKFDELAPTSKRKPTRMHQVLYFELLYIVRDMSRTVVKLTKNITACLPVDRNMYINDGASTCYAIEKSL